MRSLLADLPDGQPVEPAGGRRVEKGERGFHEAAVHQFLGDDSADTLDVERARLAEELHAAHQLRGAAGDIVAAPRDLRFLSSRDLLPRNRSAASRAFSADV